MLCDEVAIKSYGCINDLSFALTDLHALIGPNDSGKSTVLRAIRTAVQFAGSAFASDENYDGGWVPFDPGLSPATVIRLSDSASRLAYELAQRPPLLERLLLDGQELMNAPRQGWNLTGLVQSTNDARVGPLVTRLRRGARLVRFDPDALRAPSELIRETDTIKLRDERGLGLPGVYDAILNRGDEGFREIVDEVRALFPTVKNVRLKVTSERTKAIEVELKSGDRVPARFMSEGLLYFLAYAAIPKLEPTAILLVEEPENGLHPARIADVMRVLRAISKTTQVLIATQSPLVVNELHPDEVSIVTRDAETGTKVRRITTTPNFAERAKVYALGELWISYANGTDEGPLVDGGPRP